jgi:hypothetical protein
MVVAGAGGLAALAGASETNITISNNDETEYMGGSQSCGSLFIRDLKEVNRHENYLDLD